jgi:zinc/manganese transport system permease protein
MREALILHALVAPGFFQSAAVRTALLMGAIVAVANGLVGIFVVIRGQAFLGHALSDVGAAGGAGAALVGVQVLWGFLAGGFVSGALADAGLSESRGRDVATGIVLATALGFGALFLYLITTTTSNANITQTVLFGSIFTINPALLPSMGLLSLGTVALLTFIYRPLLYVSVIPEVARARGIPLRLINLLYLVVVVAAVEQAALMVGALLSTALIVGPAAIAVRLTSRPGLRLGVAAVVGVAATSLGILLAYDSFYWPPAGRGWPDSFFISTLILLGYLAVTLRTRHDRRTLPGDRSSTP